MRGFQLAFWARPWLLVGAVAIASGAYGAFDPDKVSVESPSVAARFPDPEVTYATPGFREGRRDFTSHAELVAYIDALQARTRGFAIRIVGQSQNKLALPLLIFTQPTTETPVAAVASGKPTVLIVAQQHGNEPAGSEAALAIATRLASGDLRAVLDRINVLVMPRANPDGGEAFVRDTAARIDM